jgi:rhomboid family GlyGly-CTERM serine protease
MERSTMNHLRQTMFVTITIAAAAVAIFWTGLEPMLEFDRAAIAGGQWWRMVTCHLTHWNFDHLFWDCVMFVALGVLCESVDRRRFIVCLAGSAVAISLALLWLLPAVQTYRGLSGVDSAIFVLAAMATLASARDTNRTALSIITLAALAGFVVKLGYEIVTGHTLFVDSVSAGFIPLPLSHAAGALTGLLAGGVQRHPPSKELGSSLMPLCSNDVGNACFFA